jgi:hypothetical protein
MEGMLAEFARRGFQELQARLEGASATTDTAGDQLNAFVEAYIGFAKSHPSQFDIMFRAGLDKSRHPALSTAAERTRETLGAPALALSSSPGSTADPATIALGFWALAHGLASLAIDGQLEALFDSPDISKLTTSVLNTTTTATQTSPSRDYPGSSD